MSVTIGSDSAVSRIATQQILGTGDRVAGFVALDGGFYLTNYQTTATWDCFFPVSGDVSINGGTLILNQDLSFIALNSLMPTGTIIGNGRRLNMLPTIPPLTNLPLMTAPWRLTFITSTQPTTAALTSTDWSYNSNYTVTGAAAVISSLNLYVHQFNGTTITLRASALTGLGGGSIINSVRWHPTQYIFAAGQTNAAVTSQVETFSFNPVANTITSVSTSATILTQTNQAVGWNPTGTLLASATTGATSSLTVYNVNTVGAITGVAASATLAGGAQPDAIDWSATGTLIAVGIAASPQLVVYRFTSPSTLTLDASVAIGSTILAVAWNPVFTNFLAVGLNTTTGNIVRVYSYSGGTLTQVATIAGLGAAVRTLDWSPTGLTLVIGRDSTGGADLYSTFAFSPTALTLTQISRFPTTTASNIQEARWAPNGLYASELNATNVLSIYGLTSFIASTTFCTLHNVDLVMNGDLPVIGFPLRLSGNTVITGFGDNITLSAGGSIQIAENSSVLFDNVRITGVHSGQFGCADSTSTASFYRSTLVLDGAMTFSVGRFDVINNFLITGTAGLSFVYSSTLPSNIWSNSTLTVDSGLTFSYMPSSGSRSLLQFSDNTAQLSLNSAILATAINGLSLQKGKLIVNGKSQILNQGTISAQSVAFGDGTSVANNFSLKVSPGATLLLNAGYFSYNNV